MEGYKKIFSEPKTAEFAGDTTLFHLQHITIAADYGAAASRYSFFIYVASGYGSITINGSAARLCPGNFCHLHAYHFFKITPDEADPLNLLVFSYDYLLSSYLFVYEYPPISFGVDTVYCPVACLEEPVQELVLSIFRQIEEEDKKGDNPSFLIKSALTGQLNILFRRCLMENITAKTAVPLPRAGCIIDYIYVYTTDISSSVSCAEKFGITAGILNRELYSVSGHPFTWHMKRARLNKSLSYMFLIEFSYRHVASMSGFSSECEFYKEFKEMFSVTPGFYRNCMTYSDNGYRHLLTIDSVSVITYMIEHYTEHIKLENITKNFHISAEKLDRILKGIYHCSFHEALSALQLNHARNLLGVCNFPYIDIAIYSGYNSASTFFRAFKKKYGITPNEYRLQTGDTCNEQN